MSALFVAWATEGVVAVLSEQMKRRRWVAALLPLCLAACSGQGTTPGTSEGTGVARTSAASVTASPTASSTQTKPPASVPPVPSGVYRTALTTDDVLAAGSDLGNAGIWTLTVTDGKFRLNCVPISESSEDCGGAHPTPGARNPHLVEVGDLRGDGTTMWIVEDGALRHKLNGCERHAVGLYGCGSEDPYRLTWQATADGLAFSDYFGIGDQELPAGTVPMWTIKPWTKIA